MKPMTNREIAQAILVSVLHGTWRNSTAQDLYERITRALDAKDRAAAQRAAEIPHYGRVT